MNAPDLTGVLDPEEALAISTAGLAEQHRMDPWVRTVVANLETLRVENHIAARMDNLLGKRR